MSTPTPLTHLLELLHRAYRSQMFHAPDHPQAVRNLEALVERVETLVQEQGPFKLVLAGDGFTSQGQPVEGAPNAAQALAKEMAARGVGGLEFRPGVQLDELNLFLFLLQLRPQRLLEMGGPPSLLPEDGFLRVLPPASAQPDPPARTALAPEEAKEAWEDSWDSMGLDLVPAAPAPPAPPSPAALEDEVRPLFLAGLGRTSEVLRAGLHAPWDADHRDALKRFGFAVPDFRVLAGAGAHLALDAIPPPAMRDTLRKVLSSLPSIDQGNVLLGLPGFPPEEYALRLALDFLAPELLAQAVAHAHLRHQPSRFDLALLTVALMQCVHDRDLAMEAIRGRLQFEGWGIQEVEDLKEAVQWECQGTDTKLNLSLERHLIHEQDPHLVMTLGRQLIRGQRTDDLRSLVAQLEEELASPTETRRGHGAEILADLAMGLRDANLSQELERRILVAAHDRLRADTDPRVAQWCAQALEAVLSRWIGSRNFHGVHDEMMALGELAYGPAPALPWQGQLVRDLLARVASPANIALLLPTLHNEEGGFPIPMLHSILALMGTPAASCLASWLEFEEDPARRDALVDGLQAVGRRAVPVLKECLASPRAFLVEHALDLLGKAGDPRVLPEVLLAISHHDPQVRQAAVRAGVALAGPTATAKAVADALPLAREAAQLDYLAILGELGEAVAAPAVIRLLQPGHTQGDQAQRIRLRVVETLGLIPSPEAVAPLQELFEKKGLFKGRETLGVRLTAARALAGFNTREARESMALALETESSEEVRTILRQYLVKGSPL